MILTFSGSFKGPLVPCTEVGSSCPVGISRSLVLCCYILHIQGREDALLKFLLTLICINYMIYCSRMQMNSLTKVATSN